MTQQKKYLLLLIICILACCCMILLNYRFSNFSIPHTTTRNVITLLAMLPPLGILLSLWKITRINKGLLFIVGIVYVTYGIFSYILYINPIDTLSHPIDKELLNSYSEGSKKIVRWRQNNKTQIEVIDTIIVKDYYFIRQTYP